MAEDGVLSCVLGGSVLGFIRRGCAQERFGVDSSQMMMCCLARSGVGSVFKIVVCMGFWCVHVKQNLTFYVGIRK